MDRQSLILKVQNIRAEVNVARNRPELAPDQREAIFKLYDDLDDLEEDLELETIQSEIDILQGHSSALRKICEEMRVGEESQSQAEQIVSTAASALDSLIATFQTVITQGLAKIV